MLVLWRVNVSSNRWALKDDLGKRSFGCRKFQSPKKVPSKKVSPVGGRLILKILEAELLLKTNWWKETVHTGISTSMFFASTLPLRQTHTGWVCTYQSLIA